MAMVGGGPGSFIGPVHAMAAMMDREIILVAGTFSRDMDRSREAGQKWGLGDDRIYDDFHAMIAEESEHSDGAELISITTPNATHFAIAEAALKAGMHVICDKPITTTLDEAEKLEKLALTSKGSLAITYTYTGFQMVREARAIVERGDIGTVRKVVVEYVQGWLSQQVEQSDNRQAKWRTDPALAGAGGCIGDIGVHAFNLAEFISGAKVTSLCADLGRTYPDRELDDDCNILLRLDENKRGVLHASQISTGERNDLRIRVAGDKGSLEWRLDNSEVLELKPDGQPVRILHAGEPYISTTPATGHRLPAGHPQGFIEAFANIYRDMAHHIRLGEDMVFVPQIGEGMRSMLFVERAIASSRQRTWLPMTKEAF